MFAGPILDVLWPRASWLPGKFFSGAKPSQEDVRCSSKYMTWCLCCYFANNRLTFPVCSINLGKFRMNWHFIVNISKNFLNFLTFWANHNSLEPHRNRGSCEIIERSSVTRLDEEITKQSLNAFDTIQEFSEKQAPTAKSSSFGKWFFVRRWQTIFRELFILQSFNYAIFPSTLSLLPGDLVILWIR